MSVWWQFYGNQICLEYSFSEMTKTKLYKLLIETRTHPVHSHALAEEEGLPSCNVANATVNGPLRTRVSYIYWYFSFWSVRSLINRRISMSMTSVIRFRNLSNQDPIDDVQICIVTIRHVRRETVQSTYWEISFLNDSIVLYYNADNQYELRREFMQIIECPRQSKSFWNVTLLE